MKKLLLILPMALISTGAFASQLPVEAKNVCTAEFEAKITSSYEGTSAESVRMSSRLDIQGYEAKNANLILMDVSASFYVKWPENRSETRDLAAAHMVYNVAAKSCVSVGITEFSKLKK